MPRVSKATCSPPPEIEKLKLMAEGGQITVETVQAAVADSARFDVFGLTDAVLNGEPAHALRMLEGLRGEGVEPPVILWALARELRLLANISCNTAVARHWTSVSASRNRRSGTSASR